MHIQKYISHFTWLTGASVKNSPANAGDIRDVGLIPGSGRFPEGPTPVFLHGESHGQRSLVGYGP